MVAEKYYLVIAKHRPHFKVKGFLSASEIEVGRTSVFGISNALGQSLNDHKNGFQQQKLF